MQPLPQPDALKPAAGSGPVEVLSFPHVIREAGDWILAGRLVLLADGFMFLTYGSAYYQREGQHREMMYGIVGAVLEDMDQKARHVESLGQARAKAQAKESELANDPILTQYSKLQMCSWVLGKDVVDVKEVRQGEDAGSPLTSLKVTTNCNATTDEWEFKFDSLPNPDQTAFLWQWTNATKERNAQTARTLAPLLGRAIAAMCGRPADAEAFLPDAIEAWCTTEEKTDELAKAIVASKEMETHYRAAMAILSQACRIPANRAMNLRKRLFSMAFSQTAELVKEQASKCLVSTGLLVAGLIIAYICINYYPKSLAGLLYVGCFGLSALGFLSNLPFLLLNFPRKRKLSEVGSRFGFVK